MSKKPEPITPKFNAAAAPRKPPEKPVPPKPTPPKIQYSAPRPPGPGMGGRSQSAASPKTSTKAASQAAQAKTAPKVSQTPASSQKKAASVNQPGKGTALKQQFARASAKGHVASQFKVAAKRTVNHER